MSLNRATLTILGLMAYDSENLFSDFNIPDGVDKELTINNILFECGGLELLYPDYDYMQNAIALWSERELPTWERIKKLADLEYNPIENYDRYENSTDAENRQKTNAKNDNISNSAKSNSVNSSDDVNRVAGYNSDTLGVESRNTGSGVSHGETSGNSSQDTQENESENTGRVHSSRIHGNVGVTTPAQMIESELEIYPYLNLVNIITDSFKKRFCLLVY